MNEHKISPQIDEQTVQTFQKDGVVVLKGVFKDWVAPWKKASPS